MTIKKWFAVSAGLLVLGILLGIVVPANISSAVTSGQIEMLQQLARFLQPFTVTMAIFIFFRNLMTLVLSFMFSPFLLLMPLLALVLNGWLLSFVGAEVVAQTSLGTFLAAILPHGIFEFPAIIVGEAAALNFGGFILLAIIGKKKWQDFTPNLLLSLKYLGIAATLLVPTAIIETFITPLFVGL